MKVLVVIDSFLPSIGGAEIHVQNLAEQLVSLGEDVTIFTNEEKLSDFDKKVRVIRIPWKRVFLFKILKALWVESRDVQIIHSHYSYRLSFLAGLVGRIRGIPVIVSLHGMGTVNQRKGAPLIYEYAYNFYRWASFKLSSHVIATSVGFAKIAYRYVPEKSVSVLLNGYDSGTFHPDIVIPPSLQKKYEGKKILLAVRRLVPKNGIQYLIETLPLVVQKFPNALCVLAGDGRMRGYLEERVRDLKLTEHVEFVGMVENKNLPPYISIADVVIYPSTMESASIACSEAMALGKRIVASRVGGLIDLLGENNERGILVKLFDSEDSNYDAPLALSPERYNSLASAIISCLQTKDKEYENSLAEYTYQNLSWEVTAKKTRDLYCSVSRNASR